MSTLPPVTGQAPPPATRGQSWLARLSFVLALAAVAVAVAIAEWKSLVLFAVGLVAAVISVTAAYFVLSRRGVLRWLALAVFVLTPVAVMVVYAFSSLLWVAAVSAAAWLLAGISARAALAEDKSYWRMPEFAAPPARRPFLIMNPRSGGGKVVKFDLRRQAEALGAEVFLMDGPEHVDVAAVARQAVADGADLLGVAGGDGTQALVAGVAAEHGLPFLVITAGTRNHFALDLGLDRADPVACLRALTDAVELHVDLGVIGCQTFVNNVSFGAYAEVVQTPAYRDDKLGTTLDMLPALIQGQRGTRFSAVADGEPIDAPQALLVACNPYETGDIAGLGRRARLDRGVLGVVAVNVASASQAVSLLRGRNSAGLRVLTARTIVVTADADRIPVGVDGEALRLPAPVHCTITPQALRVRVPRDRPGVPTPKAAISLPRLLRLAGRGSTEARGPYVSPLREVHRPLRSARAGRGAVGADADLRRGAPRRLVGHESADARPGSSGGAGRARPGPPAAGAGVRHQFRAQALGDSSERRRAGGLPGLGAQAVHDGTVPRAAGTGRGGRRPGADRRAARPPARLCLPALGPAASRRTARAAAHGPARAPDQAGRLRQASTVTSVQPPACGCRAARPRGSTPGRSRRSRRPRRWR
jgi:diacylglycerol kinase family enzyme